MSEISSRYFHAPMPTRGVGARITRYLSSCFDFALLSIETALEISLFPCCCTKKMCQRKGVLTALAVLCFLAHVSALELTALPKVQAVAQGDVNGASAAGS